MEFSEGIKTTTNFDQLKEIIDPFRNDLIPSKYDGCRDRGRLNMIWEDVIRKETEKLRSEQTDARNQGREVN